MALYGVDLFGLLLYMQAAFKISYKAAQAENDTVAMASITNAKNCRKAALVAA